MCHPNLEKAKFVNRAKKLAVVNLLELCSMNFEFVHCLSITIVLFWNLHEIAIIFKKLANA